MKTGFVEVKYGGNNSPRHEVTNNATANNGTTFLENKRPAKTSTTAAQQKVSAADSMGMV